MLSRPFVLYEQLKCHRVFHEKKPLINQSAYYLNDLPEKTTFLSRSHMFYKCFEDQLPLFFFHLAF